MKFVIFPVWAHIVRNKEDEYRAINDDNVELEMFPGGRRAIMFERMSRSFSLEGGFYAHCREADRLQCQFDDDSEPVRVYVYETTPERRLIPVYAGRQRVRINGEDYDPRLKNINVEGTKTGRYRSGVPNQQISFLSKQIEKLR